MVPSRTVLVLADSSRTNSFGLGLGLECLASKVVFHGLDIKLHNLCAVTDKFFACFFLFTCCWRVTGSYIYLFMTRSAALTLVVVVYSPSYIQPKRTHHASESCKTGEEAGVPKVQQSYLNISLILLLHLTYWHWKVAKRAIHILVLSYWQWENIWLLLALKCCMSSVLLPYHDRPA